MALSPKHESPVNVSVRVINSLFNSPNPSSHPKGFLADINPSSEETYSSAKIEIGFFEIRDRAPWPAEAGESSSHAERATHRKPDPELRPETVRFQGMRMGYFCVDKDTKGDNIILNRTVTLKEDSGKG